MTDLRLSGIGMTSARTRERLVQRLKDNGIRNPTVLDRIRSVPRHLFVDEAIASRAYEDVALPIGFGQTISQPWIVARMTEALLEGGPLNDVLEIGTGCGYQTAVLAPLAVLWARGASFRFPLAGVGWSLAAGVAGGAGAFAVLLAFGAKGQPAVVMSIVFAGAPIVNAGYSLLLHPPAGGVRWQFVAGILLAALGGCLVTLYKPAPPPPARSAIVRGTEAPSQPTR